MVFGYIAHFAESFLQLVNAAFVLAVLHEVHKRLHKFDFVLHHTARLATFFELFGELDELNGVVLFKL